MTERKLFKHWFDAAAAARLAAQVAAAWPPFDQRRFVDLATRDLDALEFHNRVRRFTDALTDELPADVPQALDILTRSLPPVLPDCEAVTDGWLQWPVGQFIADHGVPHLDESMHAMTELTMRFSSEFAVRPFLEQRPAEVYPRLLALTAHPNAHVRRWCSEGSRPRLPWGKRLTALTADPSPSWPILEALKDDPELYVRRSVANHLNDLAKDHPALVVARCKAWLAGASAERRWVVKHALRSLVKAGRADALGLLGFAPAGAVEASLVASPRRPRIGGAVALEATLSHGGRGKLRLVVDYVVHYARPTGKVSSKVFKWTTVELRGGEQTSLRKSHPLRHASTRTLHAGEHRVELQVNGRRLAEARFRLIEA